MDRINNYIKRSLLIILAALAVQSCIEPFDFETEYYENVLVLEATITNEYKQHEFKLSRSFRVRDTIPSAESGAEILVRDDLGNVHRFDETMQPGHYLSAEAFSAQPDREYTLEIFTATQKLYTSKPVTMAQSTEMDNLYATRTTFNGEDGVALLIDNYNNSEAARYYRYKFEETYKIISRYAYPYDLVWDSGFIEVLKTKEETTCYNTVVSNDIILANTSSLQVNNLENFLVRFIDNRNPIGSRRYSIFVTQYALSPEAFTYYETLKKLSGSDNVFSQNQPGFVEGNVFNLDDPDEKVVGMFNVSSASSKRIYFNYTDFYGPEHSRPHFTDDCEIGTPPIDPPAAADTVIAFLRLGWIKYLGPSHLASEETGGHGVGQDVGPYKVVNTECVDCTLLGTNVMPDFWEEE